MQPIDRRVRRIVFDGVAELYDRMRPTYPSEVFDDIEALFPPDTRLRILEIGCGTGQATRSLVEREHEVVAVELGASLAEVAQRNLDDHPNVEVIVADFEKWPLPEKPFDLVVSATAFHWIDPDMRLQKVAEALEPDGWLALIDPVHVAGGTNDFFVSAQRCYEQWDHTTPPGFRSPAVEEVPEDTSELEQSPLFERVELRRYLREFVYTADEYIDVLRTYSAQQHLSNEHRENLFRCIHSLISDEFGGRITKPYLFELRVAQRTI